MASFNEGVASLIRPSDDQLISGEVTNKSFRDAVPFQMRTIEAFSQTDAESSEPDFSLDALLQDRYQDGFRDGLKMAEDKALQATRQEALRLGKTLSQRFASLHESFEREFLRQEQAVAESLIDLALEIAAKVLAKQISVDRQTALPVVQECISLLPKPARSTMLRVNPDDLSWLQSSLATELRQHQIELLADESIQAGGCQLSNEQFEIQSSLSSRWRNTLAAIGHDEVPSA